MEGYTGTLGWVRRRTKLVGRRLEAAVIPAARTSQYCIPAGYKHRTRNRRYDDAPNTDQYQNEVYQAASEYLASLGGGRVYDIGCGSAYKLMKFFARDETVGFDLPETVAFLKRTYPDRDWAISKLDEPPRESCDALICSDVVEHIIDPDELMNFLADIDFKKLFLSTPDRDLVYGANNLGPPLNKAHCREWNFTEFATYASQWFAVDEHFVANREQSTQLIVCRRK